MTLPRTAGKCCKSTNSTHSWDSWQACKRNFFRQLQSKMRCSAVVLTKYIPMVMQVPRSLAAQLLASSKASSRKVKLCNHFLETMNSNRLEQERMMRSGWNNNAAILYYYTWNDDKTMYAIRGIHQVWISILPQETDPIFWPLSNLKKIIWGKVHCWNGWSLLCKCW